MNWPRHSNSFRGDYIYSHYRILNSLFITKECISWVPRTCVSENNSQTVNLKLFIIPFQVLQKYDKNKSTEINKTISYDHFLWKWKKLYSGVLEEHVSLWGCLQRRNSTHLGTTRLSFPTVCDRTYPLLSGNFLKV